MTKKKLYLLLTLGIMLLLFTACGTRQSYIDTLEKLDQPSIQNRNYQLTMKELTIPELKEQAYTKIFIDQLQSLHINGHYTCNKKSNLYDLTMNGKLFSQKFSIQLIGKKDKTYLSTNFFSDIAALASSLGKPAPISPVDLKQLDDKYFDINQLLSKNQKNTMIYFEKNKMNEAIKQTLKKTNKDLFTKKDNTLSHVITKEECITFLDTYDRLMKEDKKTKQNYQHTTAQQLKNLKETIKKNVDELKITHSINKENYKSTTRVLLSLKQKDNQKQKTKINFVLSSQPKKQKATIKLPDKKKIISKQKLEELFNHVTSIKNSKSFTPNYDNEKMIDKTIDAQLNYLIEQIKENKTEITNEDIKNLHEEGKKVFNEAQMKKLDQTLDQVIKEAKKQ
ncbi:hypothetical protein MEPL4_2c01220 [Melissococcus plutonius]|uniref:Lipoprotein n=1 Tax=Melissococcus plutonius (strain ATCC 35311 / DSM 29964 / CIP 104052 / LMG 20360 / NCIMB 702443) TaxID=940190 RepID=F3Y861_MELPT|nr:hypothetical protein [Melissococcus plutonius]AIM25488.1 hypothetical protein MEPL_c001750 [Melissococcus plutonius S1]KMT25829.1 hypothetical protein MEPL2_1c01760 [Melissococcus plutonius]KMT27174.1 hypothetical protein MEPL3_1c02030 [Melissococcus plutonius]KMT28275.1 hypothetical protein MEPL1_2c01060 [Melissococcus plutonius]KMT30012.1 hypothetical protein MEPL4_2c01220 [Melissococcus plutonius]